MNRAEAIERAIDGLEPGESVVIHGAECEDMDDCTCAPTILERPAERRIGFRMEGRT